MKRKLLIILLFISLSFAVFSDDKNTDFNQIISDFYNQGKYLVIHNKDYSTYYNKDFVSSVYVKDSYMEIGIAGYDAKSMSENGSLYHIDIQYWNITLDKNKNMILTKK